MKSIYMNQNLQVLGDSHQKVKAIKEKKIISRVKYFYNLTVLLACSDTEQWVPFQQLQLGD